jgi:hypothetical protein
LGDAGRALLAQPPKRRPSGLSLQRCLGRFIQLSYRLSPTGAHPLMKLCDPSVSLSASEHSDVLVCRALLRPWPSRNLILGESSDVVPLCLFKHVAIHSWAFILLQGITGVHPSVASVRVTALAVSTLSLSWDSPPFSDRQLEGSDNQGSHPLARCVFRVRTSLDAFLPFEPSSHF